MTQYSSTLEEASRGIFMLTMTAASQSTDAMLKHSDKFGITQSDEIKIKFDLFLPFLAISSFVIENSQYVHQTKKAQLFLGAAQVYSDDLADYSRHYTNSIHVDKFLANSDDREYYLSKLNDPKFRDQRNLYYPQANLSNINGILFDKRLKESKDFWTKDWQRKDAPNFFPLSPGNAFKYLTGKDRWDTNVLVFSPFLWKMFLTHHSNLYDALAVVRITQ